MRDHVRLIGVQPTETKPPPNDGKRPHLFFEVASLEAGGLGEFLLDHVDLGSDRGGFMLLCARRARPPVRARYLSGVAWRGVAWRGEGGSKHYAAPAAPGGAVRFFGFRQPTGT